MLQVAIYGAGHLGRQTYYQLKQHHAQTVEVLGFVDDTKPVGDQVIDSVAALGGLDSFTNTDVALVFAIGYSNMKLRLAAWERIKERGFRLHSVIHPRAIVEPNAVIGAGSIVQAGAIVDQSVQLGEACFIDIGVTLGEDSVLGPATYIAAGASIGGSVQVGSANFIGMNVTVTDNVRLGDNVFVNAKSLVHKNIGSNLRLVELHRLKEIPQNE